MTTHSPILLLSLSFVLYFGKSTQCTEPMPYRCGSSWSDADTKCGQCCKYADDCSTPGDNCFAGVNPTPCEGSQNTHTPTQTTTSPTQTPASPTQTTASPTQTTALPTTSTPAPVHSQTAAPSQTTASPTQTTPSPTSLTPSPIPVPSPVTCTSRCGSGWADADTKCGQCCQYPDDCSTPGDNCYAGVDQTPCASQPNPTPKPTQAPTRPTSTPVAVPTIATPSPVDGNTIGNYRLATISGCGSGKYVSLTFDDGPIQQNDATLTIINALNQHGIVATFYVSPAASGAEPAGLSLKCALIQQLTDGGNEVQSHSWTHKNFKATGLSNEEVKIELDTTRDFIVDCGGLAPTIFRPPYGELNKRQAEYIVSDLRYIIGLWNLDSNDWRSPNNFATISDNINLNLYDDDSINILMHDNNVYDIIDDMINLFNDGYQFITQSECFRRCDTIDSDGVCMDIHGNNQYIINEWR